MASEVGAKPIDVLSTQCFSRKAPSRFTGDTHSNLEPSLATFVSEKELGGVVRCVQYIDQVRRV
jgi:hypothetical protein